ncbi:hypothetical protein G6F56_013206 [Rhizopus delemar]|nr:hypothetical protein G6F56_013206 [Rhizopus delemar]
MNKVEEKEKFKKEENQDKEQIVLDNIKTSERAQSVPVTVNQKTTSECSSVSHQPKSVPIPAPLTLKEKASLFVDDLEPNQGKEDCCSTVFSGDTNHQRRSFLADMDCLEDNNNPRSPLGMYSPKYSSPPAGSGGKYMVRSKRASWIDASSMHESLAKGKHILSPTISDDASLKSGSLSKLREDRQQQQLLQNPKADDFTSEKTS